MDPRKVGLVLPVMVVLPHEFHADQIRAKTLQYCCMDRLTLSVSEGVCETHSLISQLC